MSRFLLVALAALLAAASVGAALFPLSLALSLAAVPVSGEPSGRVWNGRIENAVWDGRPLGTVTLRPRLLPLLAGRIEGPVGVDGPAGRGAGVVALRNGEITVREAAGTLSLAALGVEDALGAPLLGEADWRLADVVLTEAGCQAGHVAVRTDALGATAERLRAQFGPRLGTELQGPTLEGEGTCRAGVLDLPLTGEAPGLAANARLRLNGRRYLTELSLRPDDARLGRALAAYGFQAAPQGYSLVTRGAF